jgi:hypothetical protein
MAGGRFDSSLTRVRPFFTGLIRSDASAATWLRPLLVATPHARLLGGALDDPGALLPALTSPTDHGRLGCFEYPVAPPRSLLAWFIEHPEALVRPSGQKYSPETERLRTSLLEDEPPGSRAVVQAQARQLVATRTPTARGWWRFEGTSMLDCVLATDKLVITIEGKRTEPLSPATDWYPQRSQLVRNLEAAKQLAKGRAWAALLISEELVAEGTDAALDAALPAAAPHLTVAERDELHARYLGNFTWEDACEATGLDYAALPHSTDEL